jgi:hypothetical protein
MSAELVKYGEDKCVDVFCLNETWSTNLTLKLSGFEQMAICPAKSNGARRGGVVIFLKKKSNIQFKQVDVSRWSNEQGLQICAVDLFANSSLTDRIRVVSFYNPTGDVVLVENWGLDRRTVLVGDLNGHSPVWDYLCPSDLTGETFADSLYDLNFSCLNDGLPTFFHQSIRDHAGSSPDVCFAHEELLPVVSADTDNNSFLNTDHLPIVVDVEVEKRGGSGFVLSRKKWHYDKADWGLYSSIVSEGLEKIDFCWDWSINVAYNKFISVLRRAHDAAVPVSGPKRLRSNCASWWNEQCQAAIEARKSASRDFRAGRIDNAELNRFRKVAHKAVSQARQDSWESLLCKIDSSTSVREFYRLARNLTGKSSSSNKVLSTPNGRLLTDPDIEARAVSRFFSEHSRCKKHSSDRFFKQSVSKSLSVRKSFESYSNDELMRAISDLNDSAPGEDGFRLCHLQNLPDAGLQWILNINNLSRRLACRSNVDACVPAAWRKVVLIGLPKKITSTRIDELRFIGLSSIFAKLAEKLWLIRVQGVAEAGDLLDVNQFGFRAQRSCTDASESLLQFLADSLNSKQSKKAGFLQIDFRAAFDTVCHDRLLFYLLKYLSPVDVAWYRGFCTGRRAATKVRGCEKISKEVPVKSGVVQGGVASPFVFLFMMNSLLSALESAGFKAIAYADDLVVYSAGMSFDAVKNELQRALQVIEKWCEESKMELNRTKSTTSHFCLGPFNPKDPPFRLDFVNGDPVPHAHSPVFLGVTLDSRLSMSAHVEKLCSSLNSKVAVLRQLSGRKIGIKSKKLRQLWLSWSQVHALPAWSSFLSVTLKSKLNIVIKSAARAITGCLKATESNRLLEVAGLLDVDSLVVKSEAIQGAKNLCRLWRSNLCLTRTRLLSRVPKVFSLGPAVSQQASLRSVVDLTRRSCFTELVPKTVPRSRVSLVVSNQPSVVIHCDGSFKQGVGGSAAVLVESSLLCSSASCSAVGPLRPELLAVNLAVDMALSLSTSQLSHPYQIKILTDSSIILSAIRTGWVTDMDAELVDLLKKVQQCGLHGLTFGFVSSGENNAHALANEARENFTNYRVLPVLFADIK